MKKILIAFALASAVAAPVYAKAVKVSPTQNVQVDNGAGYVGTDPDLRIRSELSRDAASDRL